MTIRRHALAAIALAACPGAERACGDLAEGACAARADCVAVYRYGGCAGCPAVFAGCRDGGGEACAGEVEWTCGEERPPCGADACVPAAGDACLALVDAPADACAEKAPGGAEACGAAGCARACIAADCGDGTCAAVECRPLDARLDCEQIADLEACAARADCVIRAFCTSEIPQPGFDRCDEFCRAACLEDADCDDYEACRPAAGIDVRTCEITRESCEGSPRCSVF